MDEEHATGETTYLLHVHKAGEADAEGRYWAEGLPEGPGMLVPGFRREGVSSFRFRIDRRTRLRRSHRSGLLSEDGEEDGEVLPAKLPARTSYGTGCSNGLNPTDSMRTTSPDLNGFRGWIVPTQLRWSANSTRCVWPGSKTSLGAWYRVFSFVT